MKLYTEAPACDQQSVGLRCQPVCSPIGFYFLHAWRMLFLQKKQAYKKWYGNESTQLLQPLLLNSDF
jgi:hypothetical protein